MSAVACHMPPNGKGECLKSDEIETINARLDDHDVQRGAITAELSKLTQTMLGKFAEINAEITKVNQTMAVYANALGKAPDPFAADEAGRSGFGLLGIVHKITNAVQRVQPAFLSEHDEEGETTKVQDRAELISRMKAAEALVREQRVHEIERKKLQLEGWKLVAGIVIALLTGGGAAMLFRAFGG